MTLLDRIRFQKSIHPKINEVWLPADEVERLEAERDKAIAERDLDRLAAEAWRKHCAEQRKRREADRLAKAIANNPKPRV